MKKSIRAWAALLSFGFSASAFASPPVTTVEPYRLPVPEIETLPNGLHIAWFLNQSIPIVDLAMTFQSGTRDDLAGKSGTATLLGAVLDRGADGMKAEEISRVIESLGASRYAAPDDDNFSVGMHGLAPDANFLLSMLGKIVLHPDLPQEEVAREQTRMVARWKSLPDYGDSLVGLAFHRALEGGTIYGRGGFLSEREFKKVTRADLLAYYQKNFTPKNAVLLVVGRVNQKDFRKKIEDVFGAWNGEAPVHEWVKYQDPFVTRKRAGEVLVIDRPDLNQASVRMGFKAPNFTDRRHYALSVGNALLGEHFHSRLNSLIREKLGLTYSITSGFSYTQYSATFGVSSATKTESVGKLIQKTMEVLRTLKKGPIPDEEVRVAKDYLIGGFPLGTSTLGAVASRWMNGHLYGLGPDYLNEFVPKVSAITSPDVVKAIGQVFDLDKMVITVAGDAKGIEKSLDAAKIPHRRVSVRDLMGK